MLDDFGNIFNDDLSLSSFISMEGKYLVAGGIPPSVSFDSDTASQFGGSLHGRFHDVDNNKSVMLEALEGVEKMGMDGGMHNRLYSPTPMAGLPPGRAAVPMPMQDLLGNDDGSAMAVAVTNEDGKLKAKFVPIASEIAEGKICDNGKTKKPNRMQQLGSRVPLKPQYDTVKRQNTRKWKMFETDLGLLEADLREYMRRTAYDVPVEQFQTIVRMSEGDVCEGRISVTVGITQVLDFARRLLAEHQQMAMHLREHGWFSREMMRKICALIRGIDYEVHRTFMYDSNEECCDGVGMYDIWQGYHRKIPKKRRGKKGKKGEDKVGYVGKPETFGDAELSESEANSVCSTVELTDCDTTSFSAVQHSPNKGNWVRIQEKVFEKMLNNHRLSILVLPELYKTKVWKKVLHSRSGIKNCGYSAVDAWADVESVAGQLRTNCEFRKFLAELRCTCE